MIRAIILDFDGVILESVSVKGDAFRDLFSFAPDHTDEIVAFHHAHGGMSRFDKFRYIYTNILHEELTEAQFRRLSDRFSDLVLQKILTVPYVTGAEQFLKSYDHRLPLNIVSATPQDELEYIVKKRGLRKSFQWILGSPETKMNNINRILREERLYPGCVLYVGDALNDWEAARVTGVRFAARIKPGDPDRFSGKGDIDLIVNDLDGLSRYLEGQL